MFPSAIVFGLLLWGLQESTECEFPGFNLSVMNQRDKDGNYTKNVKLDKDETNPIGINVERTNDKLRRTEQLIITLSAQKPKDTIVDASDGYVEVEGFGRYKVYKEAKTWNEAKQKCEDDGAYLLVINSEPEANATRDLMKSFGSDGFWIWVGANDLKEPGTYVTIFGDTIKDAGYDKWYYGSPGYDSGCLQFGFFRDRDIGYYEDDCDDTREFICKKKA